jgi:SRSO17 transposase
VTYVDVSSWQDELDGLLDQVGGRFARSEPRQRARRYVGGLVAGLERKNGWTLAEHAREISPDGMQRLLRRADWDIAGVRDDIRDYVVDRLGHTGAVLVGDDTGFIKKGDRSAGVQRQYTGTSGKKDNCQIGTFLAYVAPDGHALIDRHLYLPESWTQDRDRCRAAGIPDEVEFQTKPRVMVDMLRRAVDAGCRSPGSPPTRRSGR